LLGDYEVSPIAFRNAIPSYCAATNFVFNVGLPAPPTPPQQNCISMAGYWTDVASGQPNFYWNLDHGTFNYPVGTVTAAGSCGQTITWGVGGNVTQAYSLLGSNGSPSSQSCGGNTYVPRNQQIQGNLSTNGSCGLASGTFSAVNPNNPSDFLTGSNTLKVNERVPAG
jgi:hypothetical protein